MEVLPREFVVPAPDYPNRWQASAGNQAINNLDTRLRGYDGFLKVL